MSMDISTQNKENFIQNMLYFHSAEAYYNMQNVLESIEFLNPGPRGLVELICKFLEEEKFVRPEELSGPVISLLKFDPIIKDVFSKISAGKLSGSLQKIIVGLSNVPLLLKLMEVSPLPDLEFEAVLKKIRSVILLSISDIKYNPETLRFQIALSLQCFINEYLYDQTDEEVEALKELENLIEEKLINSQQPSPTEIACLASYKPLYQYSWLHLLSMPVELEVLERRQILEPHKEVQLGSTIPILKRVEDKVSLKVQELYEQNPFPRWVSLGFPRAYKFKSVFEMTTQQNLRISNYSINEVDNPQILIAGCGTGRQSIDTASMFTNCDVLAIDLSLSSLTHAKRKSEELSISNIEYMQADILDLALLDQKFDIIESIGVLHCLDDPMAGWRVLTDCLKTGGLMRIGLYNESVRKPIVQIREEIEQSNIEISSHNAMKSFRNKIINSEEEHHKQIVETSDFYSMSMLRDWLFHVREHVFTIPQIETSLSSLGLVFCGFYMQTAENASYDLKKWDTYEKENPAAFGGLYEFWCQKD